MQGELQQPQQQAPGIYGLGGQIHWPTFFARAGIRALVLWIPVRFVGGVDGARGVATAMAGGALFTGLELAFDASSALAQSLTPAQAQNLFGTANCPAPNVPQNTVDTTIF